MPQMRRSLFVVHSLLASLLAICVGCSSGGGSSPTSSPAEGIFAGTLLDEAGNPVTGARVSIEGVEADALTDSRGNYYIEDESLAVSSPATQPGTAAAVVANVEVAVLAPGYEPQILPLVVGTGERANVEFTRNALEPRLTLTGPTGEKVINVPASCNNPRVLVEGYATLAKTESFRLDVVVVIDRSGSTAKEAFDIDGDSVPETVLEAEISATECFLLSLDPDTSRVAVVQFKQCRGRGPRFHRPRGGNDGSGGRWRIQARHQLRSGVQSSS